MALAAAAVLSSVGCGGSPVNNLIQVTPVRLANSGSALISFAGDGSGKLAVTLGRCTGAACSVTGVASGALETRPITGYVLQSQPGMRLTPQADGAYAIGDLSGLSLSLLGPSGAITYSGGMQSLSFSQPSAGVVVMSAVASGGIPAGGELPVALTATVQLAPGASFGSLTGVSYPAVDSGLFVP